MQPGCSGGQVDPYIGSGRRENNRSLPLSAPKFTREIIQALIQDSDMIWIAVLKNDKIWMSYNSRNYIENPCCFANIRKLIATSKPRGRYPILPFPLAVQNSLLTRRTRRTSASCLFSFSHFVSDSSSSPQKISASFSFCCSFSPLPYSLLPLRINPSGLHLHQCLLRRRR